MKNNPWIPLTLGLTLQSLSILIALMIPETLGFSKPGESDANLPHRERSKQPSTPSATQNLLLSTMRNIAFLGRDWRVLFLWSLYVGALYEICLLVITSSALSSHGEQS